MKTLAILGTNGLPPKYGGFETLVDNLSKLEQTKLKLVVFCSKTNNNRKIRSYQNAELRYVGLNANGSQSIIYDMISLILAWYKYEYILLLGTPGSPIIPFLKLLRKKTKIATNFGGLEWKRDKWNKIIRRYLKYSESIAIRYSDIIVADNQHFVNYIYDHYRKDSVLIEYGGDHARKKSITQESLNKYPFLDKEYGISISRAQPDNLLHVVLNAFKKVPDKNLVLISNWDSFQYGRDLKKEFSNISNIYILDAIYDLDELNILRGNASYYIHSHTFCGTAPSLVEAMNLGLPVVSYATETNFFTTERKANYFSDEKDLAELLIQTLESELKENGLKMKEIAQRRYTWEIIGKKYLNLFI